MAQIAAPDRPRERLDRLGPGVLTDAELLALVLRNGGRDASAVELATELLAEHAGLQGLSRLSAAELSRHREMGPAKASSMAACFEMARRLAAELPLGRLCLREPGDAVALVRPYLEPPDRERCVVIILNDGHRVLRVEPLTVGTVNRCLVCTRDVLSVVLRHGGTAFVLAHNHPSGRTEASREDLRVTEEISSAAASVGLDMIDHIILAGTKWSSCRETSAAAHS